MEKQKTNKTELLIMLMLLFIAIISMLIYSIGLITDNYFICKQEGKLGIYCATPFDVIVKVDKDIINTIKKYKEEVVIPNF